MHRHRRVPGVGLAALPVLLAAMSALLVPSLEAQQSAGDGPPAGEAGGAVVADSLADALARADSMRAQLVQPPGSYGGVRAMDVIRVPFQLFGATLTLGLAGVGVVHGIADALLISPAKDLREALAEVDVRADVRTLGNRSYPALVLRYEGLSPFFVEGGYSLRQYQHYAAGVETGGEGLGLRAAGTYQRLRAPHFYGVGPGSRYAERSDYAHDVTDVSGLAWWEPGGSGLTLSAGGGWERNDVARGWDDARTDLQDRPFASALYGLDETLEFARVDLGVDLDRTHVESLQTRGLRVIGQASHYEGTGGTDASFQRLAGDVRVFVPANERQLFALRVLAEDHLGETGRGVPFTHLARLGDDEGLRGHASRRFRDRALLATQAEWRYEAYWHPGFPERRVEGFAFVDAGTVGSSLADLGLEDFKVTPGLGIRWIEGGDSRVEGYVAFGGGRARLDVEFGRTF